MEHAKKPQPDPRRTKIHRRSDISLAAKKVTKKVVKQSRATGINNFYWRVEV
jgi:hypothetical protein